MSSETSSNSCIFCRIAAGDASADVVYQDEQAVAFWDANPKAPVHILIIPRQHIESINQVEAEDEQSVGHLFAVAHRVAEQQGIHEKGYRLIINTGEEGGQTVFHLHVHLMGGKQHGRY